MRTASFRVLSLIAVLALGLGACSRSDQTATQRLAARTPAPPPASSSPTPGTAAQSQDVHKDGTSSGATTNSAETASGSDPPMDSMDKDEESKSMPRPGQANDHSTLAQDPKTPK